MTALESEKLTPTSGKCIIDAETLAKYMPHEEVLLPVAAKEARSESMPDSDRQMIIKAILDLKQEVDDLRARVESSHSAAPVLKAAVPQEDREEAEWQGQGAPVNSGDIGKVVDINFDEPQAQDLSLKKSRVDIIVKALEKHNGNRKLAAEEMGISERTLYRWIEKYHLD